MNELIRVENLKKYFKTPAGLLNAVDDVSFSIAEGKTLGVVGESGCGKSTLGRVTIGLLDASGGKIFFKGKDVTSVSASERKELRKDMQIIFQDPFSSLNPRKTVFELIAAPLIINHACSSRADLERHVLSLMDTVGLAARLTNTYPHELDGGRRQRIGVARALALEPRFIVCDEPVSALDVSIQAQILNLIKELQISNHITYMFITHDLSVVKHISHDILVMYLGCMLEKCSSKSLFQMPLHPYTKGLLSAIPIPNIDRPVDRILLQGELTSPINPPERCRFANRCIYAGPDCFQRVPELREILPGHFVACDRVEEINADILSRVAGSDEDHSSDVGTASPQD